MNRFLLSPVAKPLLLAVCLLPCAWLVYATVSDQLGANPAEALVRSTGNWTLRFLCLVLAVTPLRVQAGLPSLARFRRMLGLLAYFYVSLHLLCYSWFDMGFELEEMARDITKRPFILVGFAAFVLLTPLAATSFNRAIRWLGASRWRVLHRLVYGVVVLGVLHFFWMRASKSNLVEVMVYAGIVGVLLTWRLWRRWGLRRATLGDARL